MKLYDNVKILESKDFQYCSIVDFLDDSDCLIECWNIEDSAVVGCSLLIVKRNKLQKLTSLEEEEFKNLMDKYYKNNT